MEPHDASQPAHRNAPVVGEQPGSGEARYFPVPIDALDAQELELDLYLMHAGKATLYRRIGSAYSVGDCAKLADNGVAHLYVPVTQHRVFQRVMSDRLVSAYENPDLGRAERCRIVRGACGRMIEDLMSFPSVGGIASTIALMADRFADWCIQDEDKFSHLLDMSEHDFYTTTHMVNVGVGCGMLGVELLGAESPLLREVVQGGLVHDVGKRGVPADILNKEGKLSDEEWTLIRTHPCVGVDILALQGGVGQTAVDMTRDHHERLDGHGYPAGLKGTEIGLPARICAVVDIYDALAAARPYRGPIPPERVLESMREEAGTAIDRAVFEAWERVIRRLIKREPARCVPDRAGVETPSLHAMVHSATKQAIVKPRDRAPPPLLKLRACDLQARVVLTGRARAGSPAPEADAVVTGIGPTGVRLESTVLIRPGESLRVVVPGRAALDLVVATLCFGTTGQTIVTCDFARRAAG